MLSEAFARGAKHEIQTILRARMRNYYTYILCRPSGEPFYVGKGIGFRVFNHEVEADGDKSSHKLRLIRRIRTDGGQLVYVIDAFHPDESAALLRERELIARYGRADLKLGLLTNLTDGGEGPSIPSPISREKRKTTLSGVSDDGNERDIVNQYFQRLSPVAARIESIPIKPLSEFRAGRARPNLKKVSVRNFLRPALAVLASARAHDVALIAGCRVPRRFIADDVPTIIENGVLSRLINNGHVVVESHSRPDEEVLILTEKGFDEMFASSGVYAVVAA